MSVLDNVMCAAFLHANTKKASTEAALKTIEFCGMTQWKDKPASGLPIASRKRLEITRAMATKPKLLLLDETAAGLNPTELDNAIELILKIRDSGVTIIIVEHIMKVIMNISDRILAIDHGQVIAEGTPKEVRDHPEVISAYLGEG
jgi:branched-chain amino acid transport system ATP-binding protein